jgi:hypothetical protein
MIVLIVIELVSRELDAKRLLARELEKHGVPVVIGNRLILRIFYEIFSRISNEKITWIDKSSQDYMASYFKTIKQRGDNLIVAEEECWVPFNERDYLIRRYPESTRKFVDEYWLDGKSRIKETFEKEKINFMSWRNPRFDFGAKSYDKPLTFHKGSNRILFLSSYGVLSTDIDYLQVFNHESGGGYETFYSEILDKVRMRKLMFERLLRYFISKGEKVTLRKHPAETGVWDADSYKECISEDSYINDVNNHDYIIHTGSTLPYDLPDSLKYKSIYVGIDDGLYAHSALESACNIHFVNEIQTYLAFKNYVSDCCEKNLDEAKGGECSEVGLIPAQSRLNGDFIPAGKSKHIIYSLFKLSQVLSYFYAAYLLIFRNNLRFYRKFSKFSYETYFGK